MDAATLTTDPIKLLRSLTADGIQARLDEIVAEALRVLLRSVRAGERKTNRARMGSATTSGKEGQE